MIPTGTLSLISLGIKDFGEGFGRLCRWQLWILRLVFYFFGSALLSLRSAPCGSLDSFSPMEKPIMPALSWSRGIPWHFQEPLLSPFPPHQAERRRRRSPSLISLAAPDLNSAEFQPLFPQSFACWVFIQRQILNSACHGLFWCFCFSECVAALGWLKKCFFFPPFFFLYFFLLIWT